ncbi:MAG: hypothetical protein IPJ13_22350 [Saprospiraceae bacterium]|nr:hypothetical protein [Saprospiraceae bacterium]
MNLTIKNIVFVFIWLISVHLSGQEVINLDKAVEISKANNARLRSDAGLVKYQQALVNTAYNFAPTQINAELGQFNSAYFDTSLGFHRHSVCRKCINVGLQPISNRSKLQNTISN